MDLFLSSIGDALMLIFSLSSLVVGTILFVKVLISQEYKDRKTKKEWQESLKSYTYLLTNLGLVVSKNFIYGHKNTGSSPCDLTELKIYESKSSKDLRVVLNKEDFEQ